MSERGDSLERTNWQPRQLVGPDTQPSLTELEDNAEDAIVNHRHGHIIRREGSQNVYEAAPILPENVPISDASNISNITLAQHLKDADLHSGLQQQFPKLKVMLSTIDLNRPPDTVPDYDDGNISNSWYSSDFEERTSFIRPRSLSDITYYYGESGLGVNDMFPLAFHGAHQRFNVPYGFVQETPKFGRIYQHGYYSYFNGGINETAPMPQIVAFDYLWFPFRTWFHLFSGSSPTANYSYDRTVVKRFRSDPFPGGYRCPIGSMDVHWQLRQKVGHSLSAQPSLSSLYWPKGSAAYGNNGIPSYVVEDREYIVPNSANDDSPGVMGAEYVGNGDYLNKLFVNPDLTTFESASNPWSGGAQANGINIWKNFRTQYRYGGNPNVGIWSYEFFDWMLPLTNQNSFSFRVLHRQPNDNQIDIFPFSVAGWLMILPYGSLPLYASGEPSYYGNDIGRFWSLAPLRYAPAGSRIYWESANSGIDYLIPRLVPGSETGKTQYGYYYPKEMKLDLQLIGPDEG